MIPKSNPADREVVRDAAHALRLNRRDWSTATVVAAGAVFWKRASEGLLLARPCPCARGYYMGPATEGVWGISDPKKTFRGCSPALQAVRSRRLLLREPIGRPGSSPAQTPPGRCASLALCTVWSRHTVAREWGERDTILDRFDHFTSTGLALLMDERRLDWTKPVRDYIPEFRLHDAVATDRITVRDLLRHHSRPPRHDWIWMPGDLSPAQMLAAMRYLEPSDDIRSTFQYQNLGYLVAGMVAERISGQSWTEFTRARLTDKLHMNVTFTVEDSRRGRRCRRALRDGWGYLPARETLADPRDSGGRHQHLNCELRELASPSSRQGRV
jgi:hypothetical protein